MIKNQKGVTLVELLIVLSLLSVIMMTAFGFFRFGNMVHSSAQVEAQIQASSRLVTQYINQVTRFATATHTVPKSSFQDLNFRDPGWHYLGINNNGDVVIDSPGTTPSDPRNVQVLAKKDDQIDYTIEFHRVLASDGQVSDTLTGFSIMGYKSGSQVIAIESVVEVLNSLQIEHKGSAFDPAVALAYTTIERGSPEFIQVSPDAHVVMVLDMSGSMDWAMGGRYASGEKRYLILREKALGMIDKLSNMGFDIYVSLVPFGTNANDPHPFRNVNKQNPNNELATLVSIMSTMVPYSGGLASTNTGDGIRRGYHQLVKEAQDYLADNPLETHADITQHMMILVDGGTNTDSFYYLSGSSGAWDYYYGNRNTGTNDPFGRLIRTYTQSSSNDGDIYVDRMGQNYVQTYQYEGEQVINAFVIGFSAVTQDHVSLDRIGNATNAKLFEQSDSTMKRFILATDADELDFAFNVFTDEISSSLWSIYGPRLE